MKQIISIAYKILSVCLLMGISINLNSVRYTLPKPPTIPQPISPVRTPIEQPVEQEVMVEPEIIEEIPAPASEPELPAAKDAIIQAFLEQKQELSNSRGLLFQWDFQTFVNKLYDTYYTSLPLGLGKREYSQAEKETAWLRALHSKNFAIEPEEMEAAGFTLDELIQYVTNHYQKK